MDDPRMNDRPADSADERPAPAVAGEGLQHGHPADTGKAEHEDAPYPPPSPPAKLALLVIGGYKRGISPLMPPACRFVPTCSEYGYEAIAKYGIIRGGRLALWRLLRCNPVGGSGYDPVP
jgi:putative membrane protein insertion efficiency factor